jgi:uncharacterized circularly permuted ATP-grasp superfamily protein
MLKLNLLEYDTKGYYDEMFDENNNVRPNYKLFFRTTSKVSYKS